MGDENGVFLGVISHTWLVPPEGDHCYKCRVYDREITGDGLHIVGHVVNPAVREREVAEWRFGAAGIKHILFEQDKDILSRHNIPGAIKVDFYCHDYICFALFLRNKYTVHASLLPYDVDDSEKFRTEENKKKLENPDPVRKLKKPK